MVPTWTVRGTVTRVIDGDTFVADLDLGWGLGVQGDTRDSKIGHIRLLGLNAPERRQRGGAAATKRLEALLPVGIEVWIESHQLENFGRALGRVILPDGRDLVEALAT